MGFIYKIYNDINNKVYIGLTTRSIETRWKEHLRHNSGAIDSAIQLLGKEHFFIEEIEKCDDSIVEDREKYWIEYYNSFSDGYNLTSGGTNGITNPTKDMEVINLWKKGYTVNKIVEITKLNVETVRSYLNKNNITHEEIRQRANIYIGKAKAKPILQYDQDKNFIREWESTAEAVRQGFSKASINRSLSDGKVHAGYLWKRKE